MSEAPATGPSLTLFLSGDVMLGRGVDQILAHPSDPRLFEPRVRSAVGYVRLAERASGSIPRGVRFDYVWGDAAGIWDLHKPDVRIINLETAITASQDADPDKDIHYRMHPANVPCLTAASIDCCVLANNHVLDWGRRGLEDTLTALHAAGIRTAGAGRNEAEASSAAAIEIPRGRVLVYGFALPSSGVPGSWGATPAGAGVNWLADASTRCAEEVRQRIERDRRAGDLVVVSVHWGGNWGYGISRSEREFAHRLIDSGRVDLVHGHSSHHPKGIEVYRGKGVLYGCGDLLNDYEGIQGHESFRPELALMYFPVIDIRSGELAALTLAPVRTRRFQLRRTSAQETAWLADMMDRECRRLGACRVGQRDGVLAVDWARPC